MFSTRWHDLVRLRPGQDRGQRSAFRCALTSACASSAIRAAPSGTASPQYLSESSFILAVGVATAAWHGITGWGEAGSAISYLNGHMLPDYRGGVSVTRGAGIAKAARLVRRRHRWMRFTSAASTTIFWSTRSPAPATDFGPGQLYWNGNVTIDAKRQDWANFVETGPGLRVPAARNPCT